MTADNGTRVRPRPGYLRRTTSTKEPTRPVTRQYVVNMDDTPRVHQLRRDRGTDQGAGRSLATCPRTGCSEDADYTVKRVAAPPRAPTPPSTGTYYHAFSPVSGSFETEPRTVYPAPPPRYREEWGRLRERPQVVQISPPTSRRMATAAPSSSSPSGPRASGALQSPPPPSTSSPPSPAEPASGDRYLREQVEAARQSRRRAEEEHRRAAAALDEVRGRRTHSSPERRRRPSEEDVRQDNTSREERAMARDRARARQRGQIPPPPPPPPERRRTPVDIHHESGEPSSQRRSNEETRVYVTPARRPDGDMRDRGERVLDNATRRWRYSETTRGLEELPSSPTQGRSAGGGVQTSRRGGWYDTQGVWHAGSR